SCNKTTSKCLNTIGIYKCQCNSGYEGKQCKDRNECKNSPCVNDGSCLNTDGDYTCLCHNGFTRWSGTMYTKLNVQTGIRIKSILPSLQLRRKNCQYESCNCLQGTKGCIKSPSQ
ncbi:neurogenic locus notch homolog 1-like, partial [Paramuricea clavata]